MSLLEKVGEMTMILPAPLPSLNRDKHPCLLAYICLTLCPNHGNSGYLPPFHSSLVVKFVDLLGLAVHSVWYTSTCRYYKTNHCFPLYFLDRLKGTNIQLHIPARVSPFAPSYPLLQNLERDLRGVVKGREHKCLSIETSHRLFETSNCS